MMTQRRAEELYHNGLTKYNEENSMLTHAALNERRWATTCIIYWYTLKRAFRSCRRNVRFQFKKYTANSYITVSYVVVPTTGVVVVFQVTWFLLLLHVYTTAVAVCMQIELVLLTLGPISNPTLESMRSNMFTY